MDWVSRFDLFLFDFDGLLVDTETLHLEAYREMCRRRGYHLTWTINQFFEIAHLSATGIQNALQALFPQLFEQEKSWDILYAEKKKAYEELLRKGRLSVLPGVEPLLKMLSDLNKKRCVVTNSPLSQVELIKAQLPILNTIPRWFTRESYQRPKPAPDGYLTALGELKDVGDRTIGFEDSLRGYQSLKEAGVSTPVLICSEHHPQLKLASSEARIYAPSFEALGTVLSEVRP